MNTVDKLIKCKLCLGEMKDPRILPCQHTFCFLCLKDRADKDNSNQLKCPKCFQKFDQKAEKLKKNDFISILLSMKTCGECEEKEADEFCQECDQAFCLSCAELHRKLKISKDHDLVQLYDGEENIKPELNMFCEDCDEFIDFKSIELHSKHELKKKDKGIEKRLLKWKEESKNISDVSKNYGKSLTNGEEKWSVEREELLKMKSRLEDNCKEFIEAVHNKKKIECDKIDAEINKIEERIIKYNEQIKKEMFTLKEDKKKITKRMKQTKRGLEEVLNDKSSYQLPPLLPPLNLQHHLAFKPSPTDALRELLPSIKLNDLKQLLKQGGRYELQSERSFEGEDGSYVQHDGKYLYACYSDKHEICVYSLDTLQLIKTIQCPEGFRPWHVVCVKDTFCVTDLNTNKMLLLDASGAVLDQVRLPGKAHSINYNGTNKVIITCSDFKTVVSYDVDTRKLETVPTPSVEGIRQYCSMGGDAYCMAVEIKGCCRIIKCVQGNIIQRYDVGSGYIYIFIRDGECVFVSDDAKNMVFILDGDLKLISSLPLHTTGSLQYISVDSEWNIHLSFLDSSRKFYNIRRYQLKG